VAASPPSVAQVLAPGVVLLGPQGVALVARSLEVAAARASRDGIGLPPQARELQVALDDALRNLGGTCSHAHGGTSEPRVAPGDARSSQEVADVDEVAQVLEVSHEYVRRLFRDRAFETGRKVARRWQVDRLELDAWRDDRRDARTA
jgi:hypothetical protein